MERSDYTSRRRAVTEELWDAICHLEDIAQQAKLGGDDISEGMAYDGALKLRALHKRLFDAGESAKVSA